MQLQEITLAMRKLPDLACLILTLHSSCSINRSTAKMTLVVNSSHELPLPPLLLLLQHRVLLQWTTSFSCAVSLSTFMSLSSLTGRRGVLTDVVA
eukprot:2988319-Amphidinium_carterae.3